MEFSRGVLVAQARLLFAAPVGAAGSLDLDTRDLRISEVTGPDGQNLEWSLGVPDSILGTRLRVSVPAGAAEVSIRYETSPDASALQWLEPAQTSGGRLPFMYSQCQAIHARSVVPLQDSPGFRLTYRAALTIPRTLRALMAAAPIERLERGQTAIERFEMPQPIPPYLLAMAVGDLHSRETGPRTRVWAEPGVVEAAAWEFADTEHMLTTGESLFGPYEWERYDLLVLPPSFPYGGMENPRLTFVTPTVLAGDRSLVDLVAHELAHSWTGNLVCNASADHFWLNEGFTTYAERRIMEALHGPQVAALHWALGGRALDEELYQFARDGRPQLTKLRTDLSGVDPDDAYSRVPYEKGALFLLALEQAAGRARFDAFLRAYILRFRFTALTTEEFVTFAEETLPGVLAAVGAPRWLHEAGLPADAPRPRSERLAASESLDGAQPSPVLAAGWTPTEWQLYVESLPRSATVTQLEAIDRQFNLTASRNTDLLGAWLVAAARAGYTPALGRTRELLGSVGRMKYLKPLYRALAQRPETLPLAREWFTRFAPRYHPIARQAVAPLVEPTSG